jgi:hypothetical protein
MINKQFIEQRQIENFMGYHNNHRLQPYHSSLDFLQPVLLKIIRTKKYDNYDYWQEHYKYGVMKLNIKALYKFAIKFINEY